MKMKKMRHIYISLGIILILLDIVAVKYCVYLYPIVVLGMIYMIVKTWILFYKEHKDLFRKSANIIVR